MEVFEFVVVMCFCDTSCVVQLFRCSLCIPRAGAKHEVSLDIVQHLNEASQYLSTELVRQTNNIVSLVKSPST